MQRALILACVIFASLSSGQLLALEKNTFYLGGQMGMVRHEVGLSLQVEEAPGEYNNYEDDHHVPLALTIYAGYNILEWVGIELQHTETLTEKLLGNNLEMSSSITGLYTTFQYGTEAFIRGRIGFASRTLKFETNSKLGPTLGNQSYLAGAWGVSVGQKVGPGYIELMYMNYNEMPVSEQKMKSLTTGTTTQGFDSGGIKMKARVASDSLTLGYSYQF